MTQPLLPGSSPGAESEANERRPLLAGQSSQRLNSDDPTADSVFGDRLDDGIPDSLPHLATAGTGNSDQDRRVHFRIAAAMYSFLVLGLLQSTIGVMLPKLEAEYRLTDSQVSLIFVIPPIGYLVAAYLSHYVHVKLGQRGIAWIGPFGHLVFTVTTSLHPHFYLILMSSAFAGFGAGLLDGSWCAWVGAMQNANTVSGFLHGSFSTGAGLGPFFAGVMLSKGQYPWFSWYYILSAASLLEAVVLPLAFRHESAEKYRREKHGVAKQANIVLSDISRHKVTWICAAYFLAYVGTEAAISGWIVAFMIRARHASSYFASLCSSGYWIGQAVGRLSLGMVTDVVGIRRATMIYLGLAIFLQVLFGILQVQLASLMIITLIGFALGPIFPNGVVMLTRLLPSHLHVAAVSFVASLGQIGAAIIPFGAGALSQALGIQVFQLIILAQLFIILLLWISFPKGDEATNSVEEAVQIDED